MNQEIIDWAEDQIYGPGIDSTSRPYALADALEAASTPEQVWTLFNRGWPACDAIPGHVMQDILKVLAAQNCGGTDYLDADSKAFFDGLPEVVTIYRGAPPARRHGVAWTTNIEVARSFATGHRGIRVPGGLTYKTDYAKSDILTVSMDREESEIIVDPAKLGTLIRGA